MGYEYNVEVTGAWPSFVVNPQVFRVSTSDNMKVFYIFTKKSKKMLKMLFTEKLLYLFIKTTLYPVT